jgi:hypothetical protein
MPLGIVSDEDFNAELAKVVLPKPLGRGESPQVPDSLRRIIGENVVEEGRNGTKVLTRALGISDSSLSAYSVGATSTKSYHDRPNLQHLSKARERIVKKARNRLVYSLDAITPEKLADEKPKDLASIAKDMSVIIRNMEPESESSTTNALVIFAPNMISEDKFSVIDVGES